MLIKRNRKLTFFFLIIFCFTFAMIPAFSFAASDTADDTGTVEAQEAEDLLPEDEKQKFFGLRSGRARSADRRTDFSWLDRSPTKRI